MSFLPTGNDALELMKVSSSDLDGFLPALTSLDVGALGVFMQSRVAGQSTPTLIDTHLDETGISSSHIRIHSPSQTTPNFRRWPSG